MRGRPILKAATAVTLFAVSPAFAAWQDRASPYDLERLSHLAQSRATALQEAEHRAPARDLAIARAVLNRGTRPAALASLSGRWRCRTIKLGGMTPSVVYSWFSCRIGEHNGHAYFEKLSGTQHFGGALYKHESGGYVLLGAMNWARDADAHYSGGRDFIGAPTTVSDAVGLLSAIGPNTARIEFPYPAQESSFDVIELRR